MVAARAYRAITARLPRTDCLAFFAYNRPPMPSRSRQTPESRAEARRRARLAATGYNVDEPVADEPRVAGASRQQGRLQRIFPMPPPLPGHPDPLAGFSYDGPFGSVVRTFYLLSRRPIVWVAFGITWAICYVGTTLLGSSVVGIVASLGTFGSLVAAGWFGWPRPWAYGALSAALGYVIFSLVLAVLAVRGVQLTTAPIAPAQAAVSLAFSGMFMTIIGALAGFYGGYLRRRLARSGGRTTSARRR